MVINICSYFISLPCFFKQYSPIASALIIMLKMQFSKSSLENVNVLKKKKRINAQYFLLHKPPCKYILHF